MQVSPSDLRIEQQDQPVIIRRHDAVIAATKNALLVYEGDRVPVYYVPSADVYMEQLTETEPGSGPGGWGDARYWSVTASGGGVENAVWMFVDPPADASILAGHVGFNPDPFNITVG